MKIASRFFYADRVNKKDTSVSGHICIGINGQKEFKNPRDYAVLEAFCFEAIGRNGASMDRFWQHLRDLSTEGKKQFVDFPGLLEYVKQKSYKLMEEDEELKAGLLKYYRKNKNNLGFSIE